MGKSKTTKWWRSLLGFKKSSPETSSSAAPPPSKEKKKSKWAIPEPVDIKFTINEDIILGRAAYGEEMDASKHAVAVAAATAAVAEAALAAAQAAAEVVRLTSGGGGGRNYVRTHVRSDRRRVAAAVKIQSAFRAYLARRALRALKGLVKLQALVRGHIVRKQSSDMLRRMQAMARIQARASAHRSCVSESSNTTAKSSNSGHPRRNTKESFIDSNHNCSNWFDHWMEQSPYHHTRHDTSPEIDRLDDERSDKILEIDTWKPRQNVRRKEKLNFSHHLPQFNNTASRFSTKPSPSVTSWEMSSVRLPSFPPGWTAEISPTAASALAGFDRGGSFAPKRSECSRSLYRDYLGSKPSYMANTESSRTKVRSQSAPKQRIRLEASGISDHKLRETDAHSEKGYNDLNSGRGAPRCLSSSFGF